jgi:hypothetical protein
MATVDDTPPRNSNERTSSRSKAASYISGIILPVMGGPMG